LYINRLYTFKMVSNKQDFAARKQGRVHRSEGCVHRKDGLPDEVRCSDRFSAQDRAGGENFRGSQDILPRTFRTPPTNVLLQISVREDSTV